MEDERDKAMNGQEIERIMDAIENVQDIILGMRQTLDKVLYTAIALGVANGALNVGGITSQTKDNPTPIGPKQEIAR